MLIRLPKMPLEKKDKGKTLRQFSLYPCLFRIEFFI